jgi:hypothetical protein
MFEFKGPYKAAKLARLIGKGTGYGGRFAHQFRIALRHIIHGTDGF